jgi:hypothetical protein
MPILQWLTRDQDITAADKVPYRLLEEVSDLGAGDPETGNMLIQGDNLDALKALLPFYAGQPRRARLSRSIRRHSRPVPAFHDAGIAASTDQAHPRRSESGILGTRRGGMTMSAESA